MARTGIYAIRDNLAGMLIGGLHMHKHDAPAIRFFHDVATMPDSGIARHPQDYELILICYIEDDGTLHSTRNAEGSELIAPETVLTGATWATMQQQEATARAEG